MTRLLASWLLTYLVHSTLLIGIAWLVTRRLSDRHLALREAMWRLALFGGLVTATLQLGLGVEPWSGSWSIAPATAEVEVAALRPADTTAPATSVPRAIKSSPVLQTVSRGPAVDRLIVGGWLAGAAVLLLLFAGSYLRFRRSLRGRRDLLEGPLPNFLAGLLAEDSGERAVRLSRAPRIDIPLAHGVRRWEICLPPTTLERLPVERQEIVVAHEFAHLRRFDPLWLALQRLVERLFFFQPLNRVARRSLQEIAEYRCDDFAVEMTRRPLSLAKCLTQVAEWRLTGDGSVPVPTMAAHPTQLHRRVSRLLKRSYPMPVNQLPRWLAPAALALVAAMILLAPGVSSGPLEAALTPPRDAPVVTPTAPDVPAAPEAPTPTPDPDPTPFVAPAPPAPVSSAPSAPRAPRAPRARLHSDAVLDALVEMTDGLEHIAPEIAELDALDWEMAAEEMAEAAAVFADEWGEHWEAQWESVEISAELSEGVESISEVMEDQSERLERLSERLSATVPHADELDRIRASAREMAHKKREIGRRHRERLREMSEREREVHRRARAEIERSLEQRQEILERARAARERALLEHGELRDGAYRDVLLETREELREQLRQIEDELAAEDETREHDLRE